MQKNSVLKYKLFYKINHKQLAWTFWVRASLLIMNLFMYGHRSGACLSLR